MLFSCCKILKIKSVLLLHKLLSNRGNIMIHNQMLIAVTGKRKITEDESANFFGLMCLVCYKLCV